MASGDEAAIRIARQEYKRRYSAQWRKQYRKMVKTYTLGYSPSEVKLVIDAARKHKSSTTAFIKSACYAYMNKRYLNKDAYTTREIFQALTKNFSMIKNLQDDNVIQYQVGQALLQQLNKLESELHEALRNPKSLEQLITEAIKENPTYTETIKDILKTGSYDR